MTEISQLGYHVLSFLYVTKFCLASIESRIFCISYGSLNLYFPFLYDFCVKVMLKWESVFLSYRNICE